MKSACQTLGCPCGTNELVALPLDKHVSKWARRALSALFFAVLVLTCQLTVVAQSTPHWEPVSLYSNYLTLSGNFDLFYQRTDFYTPDQNATVGDWDVHLEAWLPPFRTNYFWGPYLRVAGIGSTKNTVSNWFDNAWLASPGAGFEAYPFSVPALEGNKELLDIFAPLRLFGEYNRLNYWGSENSWRPKEQVRAGLDYFRARGANDVTKTVWSEIWTGLYYQSANDFTDRYNTVVFANSVRVGARIPKQGFLSAITPYAVLESSYTGHPTYYWENRLLVGGGLRYAPSLSSLHLPDWINRAVVYAEYLDAATYYYRSGAVPRYDIQAGISFSIGGWYR